MCVRNFERDWGSDLEDAGWTDIDGNPNGWPSSIRRRLELGRETGQYTTLTDFGAPSLAAFLQNEVVKANAATILTTTKHEECVDPGLSRKGTRGYQQKNQNSATSGITLAPDALLHLRGLKAQSNVSQASTPTEVQVSSSTAVSRIDNIAANSIKIPKGPRLPTRRTTKALTPQTGSPTGARSSDFAQYTQQVRHRARSLQSPLSSPSRAIQSVAGPHDRSSRPSSGVSTDSAVSDRHEVQDRHDGPEDTGVDPSSNDDEASGTSGYLDGLMATYGTDSEDSDSEEEDDDVYSHWPDLSHCPSSTSKSTTTHVSHAIPVNGTGVPAVVSEGFLKVSAAPVFGYSEIVPSQKPMNPSSGLVTFRPRNTQPARTAKGTFTRQRFNLVDTKNVKDRPWNARYPPTSGMAPPMCRPADPTAPPRNLTQSTGSVLPLRYDIWNCVAPYLSFVDVQNLRLTCKGFAHEIAPLMLRSVVTTFGKPMFGIEPSESGSKNAVLADSMLAKYGHEIHKFGISFEYDLRGLAYAGAKVTERRQQAWYGSYSWPVDSYPRFPVLQELEDLVDDNRPLLKDSLASLTEASELALSLDSGHGWLCGADISDLALFELRRKNGSKVFGESFQEDTWHSFGREELFKWGQENSINETMKYLSMSRDNATTRRNINDFRKMEVREYGSFIDEKSQHDFDPLSHTGGQAPTPAQQAQAHAHAHANAMNHLNPQQLLQHLQPQAGQQAVGPAFLPPIQVNGLTLHQAYHGLAAGQGAFTARMRDRIVRERTTRRMKTINIVPQWPLIFNGYNLAADVGGRMGWIQNKVAKPAEYPIKPGSLTEAQVQWLMETAWAQRAFLSAYTTAVIVNKASLTKVHTLTIAKISSGLLPSLTQAEFWASLTSLKRLKILVSPDWRNEHVPGDKFFANHMAVSPVAAASKFAEFLRTYVSQLENLSHLTIGYVGNGENATGLFCTEPASTSSAYY